MDMSHACLRKNSSITISLWTFFFVMILGLDNNTDSIHPLLSRWSTVAHSTYEYKPKSEHSHYKHKQDSSFAHCVHFHPIFHHLTKSKIWLLPSGRERWKETTMKCMFKVLTDISRWVQCKIGLTGSVVRTQQDLANTKKTSSLWPPSNI